MALWANSTPTKVAAFAGTALARAGPNPGKNALIPPALYTLLITPPTVGLPSADCSRDFTMSRGKTGIHMATPAAPPAAMTAGRLRAPVAFPSASFGLKLRLTYSYIAKYAAEPGPSLASVIALPRNTDLMPPSLYNCRTTSKPPLYFGFS